MKGFTESVIVFGGMMGLLLLVRILFVSYVSESWIGSLGLLSAVSLLLLFLAKKKKLGKFGTMFERQMKKIQQGKLGVLVYGESIFSIVLILILIFAIDGGFLAIQNNATNDWLLHILTIALVESIEIVGIMIFYRISFRTNSSNENKTNIQ